MERATTTWRDKIERVVSHIDDSLVRASAVIAVEESGKPLNNVLADLNAGPPAAIPMLRKSSAEIDLYFGWLVASLLEMRNELLSIDIEKLVIYRKANENTVDIFEKKIAAVREQLHGPHSGYLCIQELFNRSTEDGGLSNDSLKLLQEIKAKLLIVERLLEVKTNRLLSLLSSRRLAILVLIAAVISVPVVYTLVAASSGDPVTAVGVAELARADAQQVIAAVTSEKPFLQRIADLFNALSSIGTSIPGVLLLIAFCAAMIHRFLNRENWKHSGLRGVESELLALASKFTSALK